MVHLLLHLTRPLFVLDTETTGLAHGARIIELAFEQWTAEGLVKSWVARLNPGCPIPAGASAIHGITDAMIAACQTCHEPRETCACPSFHVAPRFEQIAPSLAKGFRDCDYAGKKVRFDLEKIADEMARANVEWDYVGARIVDIDRLESLARPRDLGSLHKQYVGHPHDGAHGALSDVRASTTVIVKQLETHSMLSRDLDQLHEQSWPGWLTADGKFRLVDGVAMIKFGKHRDLPMREVPIDYWDWCLKPQQKFPDDTRALIRQAKLGVFPGEASV